MEAGKSQLSADGGTFKSGRSILRGMPKAQTRVPTDSEQTYSMPSCTYSSQFARFLRGIHLYIEHRGCAGLSLPKLSHPLSPSAYTMPVSSWAVTGAIALLCIFLGGKRKSRSSSFPLPPGPPGLPIVGNVRGINADAPWLTYTEWAKKYGELVYSRMFNQDIIIINSEKVARDLLDARSTIYSDRPYVAAHDILGTDFATGFKQYGDEWRFHRKLFHQTFKSDSIPRFHAVQQRKARQLLRHILESPDLYRDHLMEYSSSVIMHAVYDYDATPRHDELVDLIVRALEYTTSLMQPEATMLFSTFPFLLKLPSWFFGMKIKRVGVECRKMLRDCVELPFEHALRRRDDGSTASAMVLDALQKEDAHHNSVELMQALKDASATAFAGASETSSTTLLTFVLAMILYPEVQEKAQAQIDAVIGKDRLPTLEDRASMPYIDAILRETLRWHPPTPLSLPHATVESDVYRGYYIPKGAIIMPNVWAMAQNGEKYPKPLEFIPERFLDNDGNLNDDDVVGIAYGFGRRICPGRHFANASVWIAMASTLAVFKMAKAKDSEGHDVPINVTWSKGLASHPLPFPCTVSPRFDKLDAEKLERMISVGA